MMNNIRRTPGRWRKIYWTGIGAKQTGLHTKTEFLNIMYREYNECLYRRRKGDKEIPPGKIKRSDIRGWMEFANAIYV